jgi:hypothetical protein
LHYPHLANLSPSVFPPLKKIDTSGTRQLDVGLLHGICVTLWLRDSASATKWIGFL